MSNTQPWCPVCGTEEGPCNCADTLPLTRPQSDTPRTDEQIGTLQVRGDWNGDVEIVKADFARALERKLAKARAELVLKIREADDAWENRNRFCGELNRIAKLLGFTGENVGPEVTTRYLVETLKELDELKSMLPWQYQAEKNREDAWRRRCTESDVCHEIHEMWDNENTGEACDVLRKYVRTTDRYSNADHAILMMEQTATEMKGLKAALQQSLSELAAARAELADQDRILRDSVPERWKHAKSPVACVQNYIGELEEMLSELYHHSSSTEGQMALIEAVLPQKVLK